MVATSAVIHCTSSNTGQFSSLLVFCRHYYTQRYLPSFLLFSFYFLFFLSVSLIHVMQNIWSKAKEISLSWLAAILTWGAPSLSCFWCTITLIKKKQQQQRVETNFIIACAELMLSGSIFITLLEEQGERSGRCNEILNWKFMRGGVWAVSIKSCSKVVNQ